jgi:hypothetical protein
VSDAPRSPGAPVGAAPPASAGAKAPPPKPAAPAATTSPSPGAKPAAPAPPDPAADDELLEFLGSLDDAGGEDVGEWLQFLARADMDKVAKARRRTPAAPKP